MEKKIPISKSSLPHLQQYSKAKSFQRKNGGRLKLTGKAIKVFREFVQDTSRKKEAGGVLLGRMIKNSDNIIIDSVTKPRSTDIRKRTFFRRSNKHQITINTAWKKSKGTCNYLGEWHTHPEEIPTPSSVDLNNWKKQVRQAEYESNALFFVIIGTHDLVVYEASNSIRKPKKMQQL